MRSTDFGDAERSPAHEARTLDSSGGPLYIGAPLFLHATDAAIARERIPVTIVTDHESLAQIVARRIATLIRERSAVWIWPSVISSQAWSALAP